MLTSKWTIAALIVIVVLALLAITGRKSVHAERIIPDVADAIWLVLTDALAYSEWNPIFIEAKGEFQEGGIISYQMKSVDGGQSQVEATVRKLVPAREINQVGGIPGIISFNHTWLLEPVEGGTRVTQREEYRGIYVWFWDPGWVERAYQEGLQALEEKLVAAK